MLPSTVSTRHPWVLSTSSVARVTALFLSFEQPRQAGRVSPCDGEQSCPWYPFGALHSLAASACYRLHSHGAARSFPQEHLSIFTVPLHHLQHPKVPQIQHPELNASPHCGVYSLLREGSTPVLGPGHTQALTSDHSVFLVSLPPNRLSPHNAH